MKPARVDPLTHQILRAARTTIRAGHKRQAGKRLRIGLFAFGGHGDFMRLLTFAAAIRKRWPKSKAHLTIICKYIAPTHANLRNPADVRDGEMVNDELTRTLGSQPSVAAEHVIQLHQVHWWCAAKELRPLFDHFWEVQYTAQLTTRPRKGRGPWEHEQRDADKHLEPWRHIFDDFPESNPELNNVGKTQFEILASSSGLSVDEADLKLDVSRVEGRWLLGGRAWEPIMEPPEYPYVVIHNGAGGRARMKCLPHALIEHAAELCNRLGLIPIQIGRKDKEKRIASCLDYRGTTILDTMLLLYKAIGFFDIEGGMRYLAHATRTPSCTFFGPTPVSLFGFQDGGLNLSRCECDPCWWSTDTWDSKCMRGYPWCRNMPQGVQEMREVVEKALYRFSELNVRSARLAQIAEVCKG